MDISLTLTGDQVTEIVRRDLIQAYECAINVDPHDGRKYIKGLKRVIEAYSTPQEWDEFQWTYRLGGYKDGTKARGDA